MPDEFVILCINKYYLHMTPFQRIQSMFSNHTNLKFPFTYCGFRSSAVSFFKSQKTKCVGASTNQYSESRLSSACLAIVTEIVSEIYS